MNPLHDAVILICTRHQSKRLPGKALKKIAGMPALEHILRRVEPSGILTVVAAPQDDAEKSALAPFLLEQKGVRVHWGHPSSPLHRMVEVLGTLERIPKYIIRITHDDVLIDCQTMVELLQECYRTNAGYGISPGIMEGAGVEVIHTANLIHAANHNQHDVEHVSYFVKDSGCPVPTGVQMPPRASIRRNYRMTMDHPEDAVVLEAVLRRLGPLASNDDICRFLDQHRQITAYNRLPLITVYTCARNAEQWIANTMGSVAGDQMSEIEYLVVDDASTDDTLTEIMKFCRSNPARSGNIRLIVNEENKGLASSSNVALNEARGQFVMRVDGDDVLLPGAIDRMVYEIQRSGAAVCYAGYDEIGVDGSPIVYNVPPDLSHHAGCALMDKKLINEVRFREGLRHWDSLDLYNRIKGKFPIAYINEPLWLYRRHAGSLSHEETPERAAALKDVAQ